MEELKMYEVGSRPLYNGAGYVEMWDASESNTSEDQRVQTIAKICSLAYGNEEAKNPTALYKRLEDSGHVSLKEFIRLGNYPEIQDSLRNKPNLGYSDAADVATHKRNLFLFKIKAPIFVARQYMRHRVSYLEMSRRYTTGKKKPYEFYEEFGEMSDVVKNYHALGVQLVEDLIASGTHTQLASRILGTTLMTEFWCMFSRQQVENFMYYRLPTDAQTQIREVAEAMHSLKNMSN